MLYSHPIGPSEGRPEACPPKVSSLVVNHRQCSSVAKCSSLSHKRSVSTICLLLLNYLIYCCSMSTVVSQPQVDQNLNRLLPANDLAPKKGNNKDETSRCYDYLNRPQRCVPEFVNAAYLVPVDATNTCGQSGPIEYCVQTGATGSSKKTCELCDATNPALSHPPTYLTDFNDNEQTWWQSETMFEGIQYPNQVNLTLHLGKAFEITYVRLKFHSPRPESFAIYKRTIEDGPWIPFQYYSATCLSKYNVSETTYASRDDGTKALCTKEFSDISPLTGGNVIFTTLEGRPSALNFEESATLQEFVTATDIQITLDRMNTFGDEIFGDPHVLKSYYYAISDLSVGGICKCNGHASECYSPPGSQRVGAPRRLICRCEHHTAGPDCNQCGPFYNDQPWRRATAKNAYECKPCNCNGRSNRCFFDRDLWLKTGHGGHCQDCADFTSGPNCERCRDNYYTAPDGKCLACNCDPIGSVSLQCIGTGQCICKPGVEGQRCDRCATNFYDFSMQGCRSCGCNIAGSWNSTPSCDQSTGDCRCKANVEGKQCDKCKPGHFNLQMDSEFGCLACFCFGHSSVCTSAPGFSMHTIESTFNRDNERWVAKDRAGREIPHQYDSIGRSLSVRAVSREPVYFVAPDKYIGDQKASYNQYLSFSLRISDEGPRATVEDIVLEGAGLVISQPIFGQGNPLPNTRSQPYKFRLHEDAKYGWAPRLSTKDFISVLSDLKALKIRVTYTPSGSGFIDDFRLESAQQLPYNERATWIEMCTCPDGYVGQFCESCAPGYKHDPPGGGSFSQCVRCNCNGHADYCDPDTGRCICDHNTAGDNCEVCAAGYYGNALNGSESDCLPCPCPGTPQGACVILPDETVACLQCPDGYAGHQCDICVDGYSGDPKGRYGTSSSCSSCNCNGNIDLNSVGNCNTTTGECLKCIYNTQGFQCENCLPGYYGNALSYPKGNCKACSCHPFGTYPDDVSPTLAAEVPYARYSFPSLLQTPLTCNQATGQCNCKPNVMGRQCNVCVEGYWDLSSNEGCKACNCDPVGSFNRTCDDRTGQCYCKPGVTGQQCNECLPYHFGFDPKGCTACDCDPIGSTGPQCSPSGQCPCRPNVEGRRCERCRENKYNKEAGCLDCPPCYTLVQDAVNDHRAKLSELTQLLKEIENNPQVVEDLNFERQLREVSAKVDKLLEDARRAQGSDGSLIAQLETLKDRIRRVQETTGRIAEQSEQISTSAGYGEQNITLAEQIIERANEALSQARRFLDTEGRSAYEKAQQRSDRFGQQSQRMSEIAREARQLADRHENEATDIENTSREALNTSETAFRLAKDAIDTQEANRIELKKITDQLEDTRDLLGRTQKMSEEANRGASKAHSDALTMYTQVNAIVVPDYPSDKYKMEAIEIIEQAKRILKEADDLLDRHSAALNGTGYQLKDARDLLAEAMRQQQITDELLADTDAALERAKAAIAGGEKILEDAKKTLDTLRDFDKTVQESKGRAEDALKKVPEIERLIVDAEGKTRDAENALGSALTDAIEARDIAREAQRIAEKASDDADKIREEAGQTKVRAGKIKGQAEELAGEVDETSDRMKGYEEQAKNDEGLAKDALGKANQAKTSAQDAARKVAVSSKTVDGILDALDGLDDIDASLLEELERRLAKAEQELKDADLDNRMGDLRNIREEQNRWMRDYDDEIEKLKRDVANIAEIRASLPDGCFRRLKLEP